MPIILLFFFFIGINSHDIQVAHYKIHQEENNLIVEFVFEKKDLLTILNDETSEQDLLQYINSNFFISANGSPQMITFKTIDHREKHVNIVGNIPKINEKINSVYIQNTCLLNIENQSNIIEIKLHNKQRDFLMNKGRTSIEINY